MKTFEEYVSLKEIASYNDDKSTDNHDEHDPQTKASLNVAMEALNRIISTKPEIIISFLNQYRNEPDIKAILVRHKMDSFQDIKPKNNGNFTEKGLGDKTGREPEALAPNSADGYSANAT